MPTPPRSSRPTRGRPALAAVLTLVALGCGSGEAATSAPASPDAGRTDADAAATPGGEPFPVRIEHKYGTTEITAAPQRIVTVGLTDHDAMLALGIVPVGAVDWLGAYPGVIGPWARGELEALDGALPQALSPTELDFEAIAALRPDLILATYSGVTREEYDTLSQIAPTVAQSGDYVDYGTPWQEMTRTAARAVGREQRAEELIAQVEQRVAETRQRHPEFDGARAVLASTYGEGSFYVYGPQDPRVRFLTALGLQMPQALVERAEASGEFGVSISDERMDVLDVDVLLWFVASEEDGGEGLAFLSDPLYRRLDVATEGRDVVLPADTDLYNAYNSSSVLSIPYALDRLAPLLAAALDGDPDTEPRLEGRSLDADKVGGGS